MKKAEVNRMRNCAKVKPKRSMRTTHQAHEKRGEVIHGLAATPFATISTSKKYPRPGEDQARRIVRITLLECSTARRMKKRIRKRDGITNVTTISPLAPNTSVPKCNMHMVSAA